jgi:hypothetical protein
MAKNSRGISGLSTSPVARGLKPHPYLPHDHAIYFLGWVAFYLSGAARRYRCREAVINFFPKT